MHRHRRERKSVRKSKSFHEEKLRRTKRELVRLVVKNECNIIIIEKGRVKKVDIKDLREESRDEGMTGISTRFITKAIDSALSDSDRNMVTPISVRDSLIKQVKEQIIDEEARERYLQYLQFLKHLLMK
mgnify:CR=1 FL=1